ncbi:hypothetical protein MCOR19_003025 [Pyricularia oryzae]|nr:hypothetical protein MCOR19_003025 [Pyricularia oryzae]KAI6460640.1 hypothetical protein MCOR15_005388 [Pyricularia oryzae]KAI6485617.1 hypothetical protein MCOR18_003710 [Pyricularia oryzae]
MPLPHLPTEILEQILTHAVIVRGLKRALRLRLVSRIWSVDILNVIFVAGLPDNTYWLGRLDRPDGSAQLFWQRYLAWRIDHAVRGEVEPLGPLTGGPRPERACDWGLRHLRRPPATRRLRMMRRVAERIVELRMRLRAADGAVASALGGEDELHDVIFRLSRLPLMDISSFNTHFRDTFFAEFTVDEGDRERLERDEEATRGFRETVLSAAAYLDELEIVQVLVRDSLNDNKPLSSRRPSCPFFAPLDAAAFGGSCRCVILLTSLPQEPGRSMYKLRSRAIQCAGSCVFPQGARDVMEFGLSTEQLHQGPAPTGPWDAGSDPTSGWMRILVHDCMRRTTDVQVYRRCYEIVGHSLLPSQEPIAGLTKEAWLLRKWFPSQLDIAARRGCVEIMEFLFDRYAIEALPAIALSNDKLANDEAKEFEHPENRNIPEALPMDRNGDECDPVNMLSKFRSPLSVAALDGNHASVDFLLSHGVSKPDRVLVAAASSGSKKLVETIVDFFAKQDDKQQDLETIHGEETVQDALALAVFREDDAMVRLLYDLGARFDRTTWETLRKETKRLGLESMDQLLQDVGQPSKGEDAWARHCSNGEQVVRKAIISFSLRLVD